MMTFLMTVGLKFGQSAAKRLLSEDEVAAYETSKGALRFPVDEPLPKNIVKMLIRARKAEIEGKTR